MALEIINVGSSPNDGTGDPLRTAYIKCNNNFAEVYSRAQTTPPGTLVGSVGDFAGMYAYDSNFFYYCFADYDGVSTIWAQIAQTGGISVDSIANGTSSVSVPTSNGNVFFSVNGTSNVVIVDALGIYANGKISATGNISGGNIEASGVVSGASLTLPSTTGNVIAYSGQFYGNLDLYGNLNATNTTFSTSGAISATGNVTSGNVVTGGVVTATGSVTAANFLTAGIVSGTGNITGGNVVTGGLISATGNIQAGNLRTAGLISATGNITIGNVVTGGLISATGNVTAGNVVTGGLISATGNITIGNVVTGGLISATGNIQAGNLRTAGLISATGNITAGNISTAGLISATGNVYGFVRPSAGTTSLAPILLTSGSNLSAATAGAIEYDGTSMFATINTTSGRGELGIFQEYRLTSNASVITSTTTNVDYFPANSAINLEASSIYEIDCMALLFKNVAGTLTWQWLCSSAPTMMRSYFIGTAVTGFTTVANTSTPQTSYASIMANTTLPHAVTGSLTTLTYHHYHFKAHVVTNAATNIRLQINQSAGNLTPQAGSYYSVRKISATTGAFVA